MLSFGIISAGLLLLVLALVLSAAIGQARFMLRPAPDAPEALLAARAARKGGAAGAERPLCVCAGDSLTRGNVSASYLDILRGRLPDWDFCNAGVNGELAWNLAERLGPIAALEPRAVTVLVGTNDVNASFGLGSRFSYLALKGLPEPASLLFYRENLVRVARYLKRETKARIAFMSIPPIGEDNLHYAFLRSEEYALALKEVAKAEELEYLPLRERLVAYLESMPPKGALPFERFFAAGISAARSRNLLGTGFDEISAKNGFHLLVDGIHLNSKGAAIAADLVEAFLRGSCR